MWPAIGFLDGLWLTSYQFYPYVMPVMKYLAKCSCGKWAFNRPDESSVSIAGGMHSKGRAEHQINIVEVE